MKSLFIKDIQKLYKTKEMTIKDISLHYLDRIKAYDGYLNSIAEINPDLNHIIQNLEEKPLNGPLYGIPIVIKDNIQTKDHMHTTANSYALKDFIAPEDATIVKKLRDQGMVILGKANLSEFAYFMSFDNMPSGYGSLHGQVVSPYDQSIDPLGSSTGSAVSVAADLVPVSIGTETNGSLMAPAYKNSIVAIKPSLGFVSRYGIIPISEFQDTAGPMAKSVEDCALVLDAIYGYDPKDKATLIAKDFHPRFYEATKKPIKDMHLGIINYIYKDFKYTDEENQILNEAKDVLTKLGATFTDINIKLTDLLPLKTLLPEFKHNLNRYFENLGDHTPIKSLKHLIEYNKAHPDICLKYGQSIFEAAEKSDGNLESKTYLKTKKKQRKRASIMDKIMNEYDLDVVFSTQRNSFAPIFGNPSISVPAKALTDLNPISINFYGRRYQDEKVITVAHHYEKETQKRLPPKLKG